MKLLSLEGNVHFSSTYLVTRDIMQKGNDNVSYRYRLEKQRKRTVAIELSVAYIIKSVKPNLICRKAIRLYILSFKNEFTILVNNVDG